MRIVAGEMGGRRINPPSKMPYTRPTTDLAKEGLFNIIENNLQIADLRTLDLFGGTGSITYELASRGAANLTIVEKDGPMFDFISKTILQLRLRGVQALKMDVFRFIAQCTHDFDFIFAGPPYALQNIDEIPLLIFEKRLLRPGGWLILEHTPRNDYKKFNYYKTERNYGTTIFSIFINSADPV